MRVIAGEFRSRLLKTPAGLATRPTPDRLRESLFSILAPQIEGTVFVDLYAGCGSAGIEAVSRGAARAVFIEKARIAINAIRENVASLGIGARALVLQGDVAKLVPSVKGDIYFLDPPYDRPAEYSKTLGMLAAEAPEAAIVIAQHASRHTLEESYGSLHRYRTVRQGDNSLSFYRRQLD
ncbi:MAG: 16S rRNA (guanine(966)-N(2))-methyltransferase RsmD [Bryobacteraceae bacterium]